MAAANELTDAQLLESRELLLSLLTSGKEKKASQKEALRRILSTVIACHKAGISFEAMQAILTRAGWNITVESLRKYYFDLRKELELSVAEKSQAKKLASAKAAIQRKLILRDTHEIELAGQAALLPGRVSKTAVPKVVVNNISSKSDDAREGIQTHVAKIEDLSLQDESRSDMRHLASTMPAKQPTSFAQKDGSDEEKKKLTPLTQEKGEPLEKKNHSESEVADPVETGRVIEEMTGEAMTLEQFEAIRIEKEKDDSFEHAPFYEELYLRENRVYFASGAPFNGTLSRKQIYLLGKNGKIFGAAPPSRTSKDFVKMPRVL